MMTLCNWIACAFFGNDDHDLLSGVTSAPVEEVRAE